MVSEVDALYAETRAETGLSRMSPAVRAALGKVERHRLVPAAQAALAYRNHPLPIGSGQTISQPYIVALSTDLLQPQPQHVVLDVGTGSGYQAAVLAEIVKQVYSIEIVETLGKTAAARLTELGYRNIEVKIGDGSRKRNKILFRGDYAKKRKSFAQAGTRRLQHLHASTFAHERVRSSERRSLACRRARDASRRARSSGPAVLLSPRLRRDPVAACGNSLYLKPPDQRHGLAVALHLDAVEEAHAEQADRAQALLEHCGIDVGKLDVADLHLVEFHEIAGRRAVGGLDHPARALAPVDAEPGSIGSGQHHDRGPGIYHEAHRHVVDRRLGEEVPARVDGKGGALTVGRVGGAAVVLSEHEHAALAVDLDGGALLLYRIGRAHV